ncbi:MAG: hypothetical protein R3E63_07425 [Pseudomonadales bacterium]
MVGLFSLHGSAGTKFYWYARCIGFGSEVMRCEKAASLLRVSMVVWVFMVCPSRCAWANCTSNAIFARKHFALLRQYQRARTAFLEFTQSVLMGYSALSMVCDAAPLSV